MCYTYRSEERRLRFHPHKLKPTFPNSGDMHSDREENSELGVSISEHEKTESLRG